jgi:hypothetical protein
MDRFRIAAQSSLSEIFWIATLLAVARNDGFFTPLFREGKGGCLRRKEKARALDVGFFRNRVF